MRTLRTDTVVAAAIAVFLLSLYGITMPGVVTFEDSGLFLQVCEFNGIAHPPGYPLFTLLCVPWFRLPLDPVILGNLLSALFATGTCIVVYLILRQLAADRLIAGTSAVLFGLSRDFWSQAIIVEVYSLNTLLVSAMVLVAVTCRRRPARWQPLVMSLLTGLALSNHWPLVVLSMPGIIVVCSSGHSEFRKWIRSPGLVFSCVVLLIIGLAPYLSLVMKQHPAFSYSGPIGSFDEFRAYVMRDAFRGVDQTATATWMDKMKFTGWLAKVSVIQFGPVLFLIAVTGLVRGLMVAGARPLHLGLAMIFLANTLGLVWLLGFDYDYIHRAVFRPYPLMAWMCMALWTGLGWQWLAGLGKQGGWLTGAAAGMAGMALLAGHYVWNNRSEDTLADRYARFVLESLPQNASLVVTSDPQVGPLSYLHNVEGLRRDIGLYEEQNLFLPNRFPGETREEKLAYVERNPPFYSIGIPWLTSGIDYGFFLRHDPDRQGFGLPAGASGFVLRLADDFRSGRIRDPNTRYFAHQLLIALTNGLTGYAHTHAVGAREVRMLRALQGTFPGILATLSMELANPGAGLPPEVLLGMALPFDGDFGEETADHEIAAFYYYLSLILLEADFNPATDSDGRTSTDSLSLAKHYLHLGIEAYPVPENPCRQLLTRLQGP